MTPGNRGIVWQLLEGTPAENGMVLLPALWWHTAGSTPVVIVTITRAA